MPGFAASAVTGHAGRIRSVDVEGHRVLVFLGRTHLYEHRDPAAVAHPVRVAAACGCRAVVLTNACGAIRETFRPGDLVVISDHVNMTAVSPLEGATFVDLSDLYSRRLRALCHDVDPSLAEGVYVGYWGPNYETPAEIRAYRTLGGDLVGMSTVLEAIAARAAGLEVLGLSLVTNMAAGIAGPLTTTRSSNRDGPASSGRGRCSPPSSPRSSAAEGYTASTAAWMAATSTFFIPNRAVMAALGLRGSGSLKISSQPSGTTCHERP